MFTGIVTAMGRIVEEERSERLIKWGVESPYDPAAIAVGASIAHAGCCLTVIERDAAPAGAWHVVEIAAESIAKTTLPRYRQGDRINLEQSLRLGDELGGHLMAGHVDGVGLLRRITAEGPGHHLVIEAPGDLAPLIAKKGSISIDGVSLTVNAVDGRTFSVLIIPHTWEATSLHRLKPGDGVNLEADLLARYVERIVAARAGSA
jgi:riboflavin synthase